MPIKAREDIEATIIGLCSEDDYGSWELWWNIFSDAPDDEATALRESFVNVVSELISSGRLVAKRQRMKGQILATKYDREELEREIDSAGNPDPGLISGLELNEQLQTVR
jgi:hypothetical protein